MRTRAVLAAVAFCACGPKATQPIAVPPPPPPDQPPPPPDAEVSVPTFPTQTAAPQELVFPNEPFRLEQPKPGVPRPFGFPPVKQFTLANGLRVYLVEQHALPIVSMDLNLDGGSLTDPRGREGLASLCMGMLTEGTDKLDKLQYAEALADVASSISAYATEDSIGLQLSSLSKHLPVTFAQFATTITSPAFRASDFERMVKRRTEAIRQSKGNPAGVASRVFSPVVYGREHPLGAVTTEASLGAIKIDDCKKLAATALKPGGARLFVVGDLTEAQIRKLFDEPALATWRGAVPRAAAAGAAKPLAGRIFFVDVPGSAQSVVTMVHAGPRRDAADYFATTLMAQVFGGSFSSRINMNLRENKGYSYGARGGFQYTKSHSWFSASASVRTDSTYQTILEINSDVRALATAQRPIEAAELEREQRGMVLGLPGQFATGQQALGNYRRLVYYGLPMDYYGKLAANVERVNLATVKDAASKHLRPSDAIYIVVGDGSAMMKVREGTTDVPMLASGKPVTLRQALETMVETKHLGPGALISIDADGQVISR